jgi:hypothetical protein
LSNIRDCYNSSKLGSAPFTDWKIEVLSVEFKPNHSNTPYTRAPTDWTGLTVPSLISARFWYQLSGVADNSAGREIAADGKRSLSATKKADFCYYFSLFWMELSPVILKM